MKIHQTRRIAIVSWPGKDFGLLEPLCLTRKLNEGWQKVRENGSLTMLDIRNTLEVLEDLSKCFVLLSAHFCIFLGNLMPLASSKVHCRDKSCAAVWLHWQHAAVCEFLVTTLLSTCRMHSNESQEVNIYEIYEYS